MILFALMGLISFDGKYVLNDVDIEKAHVVSIDYSFEKPCTLNILYTKGYEFYHVRLDVKDTKGTIRLNLDKIKFTPTRRKPTYIPFTIEGTCSGTIDNIKVQ